MQYEYPELYDRDGDLSKRGFVAYKFRHPETGKMKMFQPWISSRLITKQALRAKGNQIIDSLLTRLRHGYNPFQHENIALTNIVEAINNAIAYKSSYVKRRTIISARSQAKNLIQWLESTGNDKISEESFNYQHALKYTDDLKLEKKISNRTRNNYVESIRNIFTNLVNREYILTNPFKKIKPLPETDRTVYAYNDAELQLIKNSLPSIDPDLWLVASSYFIRHCARL